MLSIGAATIVAVLNTITLFFGGTVTYLSYRAYRRTGSPSLRALSTGLGFVTIGTLVAGALHQVLGVALSTGIIVQSGFTAIGFTVLSYSLFTTHDTSSPTASSRL